MEKFGQWLTASFNTRELATGIWLLVIVLVVLLRQNTRSLAVELLRSATQWKLLVLASSFAAHIIALCWLLAAMALWSANQLGSTALWFFLSGIALLGRSLSINEDDPYFRELIKDSFKAGAIFEFIVVAHTFNIFAELLFVPVFTILGAFVSISQMKAEFRHARILFEVLLIATLLALLWYSLSKIWSEPSTFFTTETGRNFLLPIFLTIGSIPFFYLWYCISNFENANIRIGLKNFQSDELKRYARRRFFKVFFLKPWLLHRAVRQFQILPAEKKSDVDSIIGQIKTYEKEAKCPPPVDDQKGWSPYLARDFLQEHDLRTGDFHPWSESDEWWAESPYVDLDSSTFSNKVAFYLEGRQGLVTKLKLSGRFNIDTDNQEARDRFVIIAVTLIANALDISVDEVSALLPDGESFEVTIGATHVSVWIEEYPNRKGFCWDVLLSRAREKQE